MHDRSKGGCGTDLTRDKSGFLEFVDEIGPVPAHIEKLSVGRKDHAFGYVRGNYQWQCYYDNAQEAVTRTKIGKSPTETTRRKLSESMKGIKRAERGLVKRRLS